jgi:uncharacterized protein (TIGR03000 family)
MKLQRSLWVLLAAALLLSPLAAPTARAQRISGAFNWGYPYGSYPYFYTPGNFGGPFGGGVGMTPFFSNWGGYPGYGAYPMYYSYQMPYPAYGILPPPFLTAESPNRYAGYSGSLTGRTAEDYGYGRDYFDRDPQRRNSLSPAIPYRDTPKDKGASDALADSRRVRIEVTVPDPDATVIIDGGKTQQSGRNRIYVTPPLQEDRFYTVTVEVQWNDDGKKTKTASKAFDVIPGETIQFAPK